MAGSEDRGWSKAWWLALAVVTALRTAAAGLVPLQGTEAYYWAWSRHLAAGYYDHPPLVAWAIRASTWLLGTHELSVRLPSLVGVTLATVAVWWLARRTFGEEAGARSGLAALAFPYLTVVACLDFPDGLLLGATGLALALLWEGRLVASGVALGLGMLAKFPAALVGLATILWSRSPRFLAPWFAAAVVTLSPFLFWNAVNDWATFAYQLGTRTVREGHLEMDRLLEFLAVQAGVASPVLWGVVLAAAVWAARRGHEAGRFLAFHSLVPLGFFAALGVLHEQSPHWPLVGYLAALAAVGPACAESRGFRIGWWVGVGLGGALTAVVLAAGLFPGLLFSLAGRPQGASITEPFAYRGLAGELEARREGAFLVTESHGLTSALEFYSGRRAHWFSRNLHGREFLRWEDYGALRGRDGLFVDTLPLERRPDVRELLAYGFEQVGEEEEVLVDWRGKPARTFYLVRCRRFRGLPPPVEP